MNLEVHLHQAAFMAPTQSAPPMSQWMRIRTLIAGITAPVIGIAVALAITKVVMSDRDFSDFPSRLAFIFVLGAPGAYLLEVALGFLVYKWMQRRNAVTLSPVLLTGAVAGSLALVLPFAIGGAEELGPLGLMSLVGAIGGLAAAVWFWLLSGWGRRERAA